MLGDAMHELLTQQRPHMIPLVEAFAIDAQDYNTIGNPYGDIYELQLNTARSTRLNKHAVPSFYHDLMKPIMAMQKAKL